ncbi:calcium-binding protein [Streptomyces sp. NPDC054784]
MPASPSFPSAFLGRRALRAASALTLALGAGLAAPVLLAGTAAAAPSAAPSAPAGAVEVSDNGRELTFTAGAGQANELDITEAFTNATDIEFVIDDVAPITPGHGCAHPDPADDTKVTCAVVTVDSQSPYRILALESGDGDDTVTIDNTTDAFYTNSFSLGAGNDELTSTGSVHIGGVSGGDGDDTLTVGSGSVARGDDGDDTIRTTGDIAEGGAGNDVLTGGAGGQTLRGDAGEDVLRGGDGDDLLEGGKDDDVLYGEKGFDQLWGNSGDDELYGGPDEDVLSGGPGEDVEQQD